MDLMIDIETMDTKSTAVVLSIGAVLFDPYGNPDKGTAQFKNVLYVTLDISPQLDAYNRTISESTVNWWLCQSAKARRVLADDNRLPVNVALESLGDMLVGAAHIWAKSPEFDMVILNSLCEAATGKPLTRAFWLYRDVRTALDQVWNSASVEMDANLVEHDALGDAMLQCLQIQKTNKLLTDLGVVTYHECTDGSIDI